MAKHYAVGIDLGTTYSCIAYLNEHGKPVTIPNEEGDLSTPSAVFFDGHDILVGNEALRNSVITPARIITQSKRYIGETLKRWPIDGKFYTPVDISAIILKHLIKTAEQKLGRIERAVITVPAQFSDIQRQNTIEAGLKAGLEHVDIINEPVAAALCYVLGTEGLWFTELAEQQRIMVYDLGGGTLDISIVQYKQDEVKVIATGGDLMLGGLDWNDCLIQYLCDKFDDTFKDDPRLDPSSMQQITLDVEQLKRSLSARQKSTIHISHAGKKHPFEITQEEFQQLTQHLVDRSEKVTRNLLKVNNMGWAHVDVVLSVGGSTRMPMIMNLLKKMSGRTLNSSLSPDQSIAHGAAYYAGMLLSNSDFARAILSTEATARLSRMKQQSVTARSLGILVRDENNKQRVPHYLMPANTTIPASTTAYYGTIQPNQKRVRLQIVESDDHAPESYILLGDVEISPLPSGLPENSPIAVTFSYDLNGRVQVAAKEMVSGKIAHAQIIRPENVSVKEVEMTNVHELFVQGTQQILDKAPLADQIGKEFTLKKSVAAPPPKPAAVPPAKKPLPPAPDKPIFIEELVKVASRLTDSPDSKFKSKPKITDSVVQGPIKKKDAPPNLLDDTFDLIDSFPQGLESSERPVLLCDKCGEVLNHNRKCPACSPAQVEDPFVYDASPQKPAHKPASPAKKATRPAATSKPKLKQIPPASNIKNLPARKPEPPKNTAKNVVDLKTKKPKK